VLDAAPAPENSLRMGSAPTAFWKRIQAGPASGQPFDIIEYCHKLGLTGVQTNPSLYRSGNALGLRKYRYSELR
jgi:hypothetical protein